MKYFLLVLALALTSCKSYQKSVDSRSLGVSGSATGGKIIYSVHYK